MANIEIEIEGIIVMMFERDAQMRPTACVLGVVDNVPGHQLAITFDKNHTGNVPVAHAGVRQLTLTVENTSTTGIRFFKELELNRVTGLTVNDEGEPVLADVRSASWILEFEGQLYPQTRGPIGVNPNRFHPILHINDGEIRTSRVSDNHLLVRPENAPPEEPFTLIGRVATKVKIISNLSGSTARLSNDLGNLVEAAQADTLNITVALTCPSCARTGQQTAHGNNYYRAIGTNLQFGERLLLSSTKLPPESAANPPIAPEASCLIGQAGQSNPNGG